MPQDTCRHKPNEKNKIEQNSKITHVSPKAFYSAAHSPRHAPPLSAERLKSGASWWCLLPLHVRCQQLLVGRIRPTRRCPPSLSNNKRRRFLRGVCEVGGRTLLCVFHHVSTTVSWCLLFFSMSWIFFRSIDKYALTIKSIHTILVDMLLVTRLPWQIRSK